MPGVPILAIDYSLAPENRFPTASQEILDVYLWCISGKPEVEEMLGFQPKRIVVTGDSSGGLLLMVNTMILNDIRKQFPKEKDSIKLPVALVGFYSSFTIEALLTPSFITATVHPILFPSVFCSFVDCYIPDGKKQGLDENGNPLPEIDEPEPSWLARTWTNIKHPWSIVHWFWSTWLELFMYPTAWYDQTPESLRARLVSDHRFCCHPYMSPLNYDDFESLQEMSLHLISMRFEPILDHSVMMAKKWKGPIKFEMMGELVHAYLNLLPMKGQYEEGYNHAVATLKSYIVHEDTI